ncbi:MAG: hypothetical protein KBT32_04460 [Bacteroidales bacterium]|nr:hypothetical protein [Candidatus Physcocola equi]
MKFSNYAFASAVVLASCTGGADNGNGGQSVDSTNSTSQQKTIILEKTAASAETKVKLAHEVKGPVRLVVSNEIDGLAAKFDEKGQLIYRMTSGMGNRCQILEQPDGSLYMTWTGTVLYYTNSGKLDSIVGGEEGYYFSQIYNYGPDGNVNEIVYIEGNEQEGETLREKRNVKVLETDAHGNWLKRKEGDMVVVREISYYGEPDNVYPFRPNDFQYHFCGKISTMDVMSFTFGGKKEGECVLNGSKRNLRLVSFDEKTGDMKIEAKMNGKVVGYYEGKVTITDNEYQYKGDFKNVNGASVPFELSNACL